MGVGAGDGSVGGFVFFWRGIPCPPLDENEGVTVWEAEGCIEAGCHGSTVRFPVAFQFINKCNFRFKDAVGQKVVLDVSSYNDIMS